MRTRILWAGIAVAVLLLPTAVMAQVNVGSTLGTTFGLGTADLESTVINIVQWVLGFLGLIALLAIFAAIIVAATAGGNEDRAAIAKKALVGAIVGLIVILLAWAIVTFVIGETNSLTQ